MGPPVSAAVQADGQLTRRRPRLRAQAGRRAGGARARRDARRAIYLAYRRQLRGKATVDVLPEVLAGALRDLQFPKQMRWDAQLEDGKGELLFGRPIRWLLFLYGGRVVPFDITRTALGVQARSCRTSARARVTYGHRFLTTSGRRRAGHQGQELRRLPAAPGGELRRARTRRAARPHRPRARRRGPPPGRARRGLARRAGGAGGGAGSRRVSGRHLGHRSRRSSCSCPAEVLTTTMIHHQHFFPVVVDQGALHAGLPRRAQHGAGEARGDRPQPRARADGPAARRALLLGGRPRADAGAAPRRGWPRCPSTRGSAASGTRPIGSSRSRAGSPPRCSGSRRRRTRRRRRAACARPIWPPTWCASSPSCRARWAASTRANEGVPEAVWKAIYHHYLPTAVEADGAPAAADLGEAAVTWAAVSLADKLDTLAGHVRGRRAADRVARSVTACAARRRAWCGSWPTCPS